MEMTNDNALPAFLTFFLWNKITLSLEFFEVRLSLLSFPFFFSKILLSGDEHHNDVGTASLSLALPTLEDHAKKVLFSKAFILHIHVSGKNEKRPVTQRLFIMIIERLLSRENISRSILV